MNLVETSRRVRRGERRLMKWQRRLWLAELALWPTVLLLAVLLAAAGWLLWRRSAGQAPATTDLAVAAPPAAPVASTPGGEHAP